MYEKSPIFHAKNIEAPVFLMIGKVDLRVPPSQGHEFYHHLKALGKEVSFFVF
jgi:acylaminoacyl-peptidase